MGSLPGLAFQTNQNWWLATVWVNQTQRRGKYLWHCYPIICSEPSKFSQCNKKHILKRYAIRTLHWMVVSPNSGRLGCQMIHVRYMFIWECIFNRDPSSWPGKPTMWLHVVPHRKVVNEGRFLLRWNRGSGVLLLYISTIKYKMNDCGTIEGARVPSLATNEQQRFPNDLPWIDPWWVIILHSNQTYIWKCIHSY